MRTKVPVSKKVKAGAAVAAKFSKAPRPASSTKKPQKKNMRKESLGLPRELLLQMHDLMVKSRVLEERLIKVYRTGEAYFWIGGPGEEAFGVPLGLLVNKGQGPEHDYLHLHYRATPTLIAMGMTMVDSLRLMMNRATDPSTGGRNFCNHYCFPQWNVVPVSSPIEVQYGMAIGTGIVQRRYLQKGKTQGISIVTGGDAGTAEGDFASCLIWASRPGSELPILITVQNNKMGISTSYDTQHGEKYIADRAKAFGIRSSVVNGNDPIETYLALQTEMDYIRRTGKPSMMEFQTTRLYGHSSASGANREKGDCCIELFEKKLVDGKLITSGEIKTLWKGYEEESKRAADIARSEPAPSADTIWDHTYAGSENADWRKF
jgi:2-oxoisovalerate dehydrogenase E1 component alpha subunit